MANVSDIESYDSKRAEHWYDETKKYKMMLWALLRRHGPLRVSHVDIEDYGFDSYLVEDVDPITNETILSATRDQR